MAQVDKKLKRLLLYRLSLVRFKELGFEKVYSYSIGNASGVSAVQVRKDFSAYGIKGHKRGGYEIDLLLTEFDRVFDNDVKNIVIVGMGNIGKALAQYSRRFLNRNLNIVAGFDIDPSKHKRSYGLPVFAIKKLPEILKTYNVKTAVIAVPQQMAQDICNILVEQGINGILNFSPFALNVPDDVVVNDINISNELESIVYRA